MFDGNTFLPVTGMPIRKIACMIRPLADAEPVPLAVAILKANSLMRFMDIVRGALPPTLSHRRQRINRRPGVRNLEHELAHVPRVGRAALGAESAVQADVLVLDHHPPGLL